jgi:hypothetical protein
MFIENNEVNFWKSSQIVANFACPRLIESMNCSDFREKSDKNTTTYCRQNRPPQKGRKYLILGGFWELLADTHEKRRIGVSSLFNELDGFTYSFIDFSTAGSANEPPGSPMAELDIGFSSFVPARMRKVAELASSLLHELEISTQSLIIRRK